MATVTTNNQYYTDIANAIRGKNGTEIQYKPSEMAAAITAISGGGEEGLQILNGSFIPSEDTKEYTVEHNLGKIPRIVCFFLSDSDLVERDVPTFRFNLGCDFLENGKVFNLTVSPGSSNPIQFNRESFYGYPSNSLFAATTSAVRFGGSGVSSLYYMFKAGVEYQWFIVG